MTKDYTTQIAELLDARGRMQILKRTVASEVRLAHEASIQREIKDRTVSIEAAFAQKLAVAAAAGVPQSLLRSKVLKTNDWERWVYWRDLAEIEPERVSVQNAKEAKRLAEAASTWDFEEGLFYIRRGPEGNVISDPVAYRIDSIRRAGYDRTKWFADPLSESRERAEKTGLNLHAVIQEAIDNKIIDAPEEES